MMKSHLGPSLFLLALFGCASGGNTPRVVVNEKIATPATLGVISFRDCVIPTQQDDCPGSGNVAGPEYARVLATKPGVKVVPISRPVSGAETLSDDAAVALGREKHVDYVVTGEVRFKRRQFKVRTIKLRPI